MRKDSKKSDNINQRPHTCDSHSTHFKNNRHFKSWWDQGVIWFPSPRAAALTENNMKNLHLLGFPNVSHESSRNQSKPQKHRKSKKLKIIQKSSNGKSSSQQKEDSAAFIELWERLKMEEKKKSLKANIKDPKSKEHRAWEKQKQKILDEALGKCVRKNKTARINRRKLIRKTKQNVTKKSANTEEKSKHSLHIVREFKKYLKTNSFRVPQFLSSYS